jgi:hypothetical protein
MEHEKRRTIPDFQNLDLRWQRTNEDKGRTLFDYYLKQCDQKDIFEIRSVRARIVE